MKKVQAKEANSHGVKAKKPTPKKRALKSWMDYRD